MQKAKTTRIFYLVNQWKGPGKAETQGIFSSHARAVQACRNWRYYILPLRLNVNLPDRTLKRFEYEYPIRRH